MNTLVFDTRKDELLSEPGIPFYIDYPALRSGLDVTLHIAGEMSCEIADGYPGAAADPAALCADVCSALSIAVSEAADRIGSPTRIPEHAEELSALVRARLARRWAEHYGAAPGTLKITEIFLSPEDRAMMEKLDRSERFALESPVEQQNEMAKELRMAQIAALQSIPLQTGGWTCACGTRNTGKYCTECGKRRVWACECGTLNNGNFCTNCGKRRI